MSDETKSPILMDYEWHARKFSKCADEWEETCRLAGKQAEDSWRRTAEEYRDLAQKLRQAARDAATLESAKRLLEGVQPKLVTGGPLHAPDEIWVNVRLKQEWADLWIVLMRPETGAPDAE